MASDEHKRLALYLKNVHSALRNKTAVEGVNKAWLDHCANKDVLKKYSLCMEKLANTHWEQNSSNKPSLLKSRIQWSADFCYDYFNNNGLQKYDERERNIGDKIGLKVNMEELFSKPYKLLDVGSCYNPFEMYDFLEVFAIDLCPANASVKECDFLNVSIGPNEIITDNKVVQLQENYFDVITFCFLLEYIPSSELRVVACENAYKLLRIGGLLIINTPDSKHVGANSKLMKSWRYSLATMGFSRIKYEKFKHMHCMAFRKSLHKDIAVRWSTLYKESYMDGSIKIPQDFNKDEKNIEPESFTIEAEDFNELPLLDKELL
ncbi:unnamed protein product, partial [Brenthis ino]